MRTEINRILNVSKLNFFHVSFRFRNKHGNISENMAATLAYFRAERMVDAVFQFLHVLLDTLSFPNKYEPCFSYTSRINQ